MKKIVKMMVALLLLLTSTGLTISASNNQEMENSYVKSLELDKSEVVDGENVNINIELEGLGPDKKINSNDQITINWTNISNNKLFYAAAYNATHVITNNGIDIGTLIINTDDAVIKFNDNVNSINDVALTVKFELSMRTHDEVGSINPVHISAGNITKVVNVQKQESGTEAPFFYKVGDIIPEDPENIRWFLNINNNNVEIKGKEIYLEDKISQGHEMKLDSLVIDVTEINQQDEEVVTSFKGQSGLKDFLNNSGSEIEFSKDPESFKLSIPSAYASKKSIMIFYNTIITNKNRIRYTNQADIRYQLDENEIISETFKEFVHPVFSEYEVEGAKVSELKLIKYVDNTLFPVKGVQFEIKRVDREKIFENTDLVLVTDEQGTASVQNLPNGKYELREVYAPEYLDYDDQNIKYFTIDDTDDEGVTFVIYNSVKEVEFSVEKTWKGLVGNSVTMNLLRNGEIIDSIEITAEDEWKKSFEKQPISDAAGNRFEYSIEEVPLENYESLIIEKTDNHYVFENRYIPETQSISVEKIWDGQKLDHIEIYLKQNNEIIDKIELCDENNWRHTFEDIPKTDIYGTIYEYEVVERYTEGYTTNYDINDNHVQITNTQILGRRPDKPNEDKVVDNRDPEYKEKENNRDEKEEKEIIKENPQLKIPNTASSQSYFYYIILMMFSLFLIIKNRIKG